MTDLPRYSITHVALAKDPDGYWVQWLDVSLRLQQLALPCPHCHLPRDLPAVCTPDVNAAIDVGIAQNADLFEAGRQHANVLPPAALQARLQQLETAALLKDRTRRAIRERAHAGESHASLAEDYGVPEAFIAAVCDWQLFGDVPDPRLQQLAQDCDAAERRLVRTDADLEASEARVQQLEQEKARLETELKELRARVAQTGVDRGDSVPHGGIG